MNKYLQYCWCTNHFSSPITTLLMTKTMVSYYNISFNLNSICQGMQGDFFLLTCILHDLSNLNTVMYINYKTKEIICCHSNLEWGHHYSVVFDPDMMKNHLPNVWSILKQTFLQYKNSTITFFLHIVNCAPRGCYVGVRWTKCS